MRACLLDKCYMPSGLDVRITNVLMFLNLCVFFSTIVLHSGVFLSGQYLTISGTRLQSIYMRVSLFGLFRSMYYAM